MTRTQKRAQKTRQRLLDAAFAAFCKKGVDASTIQDITEKADLGKGTFYRHFSSKDQVFIALIENATAKLIHRIQASPRPGQSALDALGNILQAHLEFFAEHRDVFVLLFQGGLLLKTDLEKTDALAKSFADYLAALERQLVPFTAGHVNKAKLETLASALAGAVSAFHALAMMGLTSEEATRSLDPFTRLFLTRGLMFLDIKDAPSAVHAESPSGVPLNERR